jgi:hypothetical protein
MSTAPRVSVQVCTPCYGGMANIVFFNSLLKLQTACAERGVGLEIKLTGGDALVTRARSRMACDFLETDHTHLLFVDADIGFDPGHLFRLLDFDKPLVGGVYPLKTTLWDKVADAARRGVKDIQAASLGYVVRFMPSENQSVELEDGFGQVAYLATGFMLIRREVLTRVAEAHPDLASVIVDMNAAPKRTVMFFETMIEPESREHLSEDYAFCRRWRDVGGEVWADFQTRMTHVGHAQYTGSLLDAVAN